MTTARIHELCDILDRGYRTRASASVGGCYPLTSGRVASILREAGIADEEIEAFQAFREGEE